MQLVEAWKLVVLQRYTKFDGRSGRPEFWWYVLANVIISAVLWILAGITGSFFFIAVAFIYGLAVIVPNIAVGIRRLHDSDKTGWLLLVWFIPFIGWIIVLVFMAQPSTAGPNQYGAGPDPASL